MHLLSLWTILAATKLSAILCVSQDSGMAGVKKLYQEETNKKYMWVRINQRDDHMQSFKYSNQATVNFGGREAMWRHFKPYNFFVAVYVLKEQKKILQI